MPPADSALAEREVLREAIRHEELERLRPIIDDPDRRRAAADAFAELLELFATADAAENRYDEAKDSNALDLCIATIDRMRADQLWPAVALDRRVVIAVKGARVVRERYEVRGDRADLDRALRLVDEAEELARAGAYVQLPLALNALGNHLTAAFDADASRREVIDRAVSSLREASELEASDSRAGRSSRQLAAALLMRAKALGTTEDLDEAVMTLDALLEDAPDDHETLYHLGTILIYRAEQSAAATDLDRAVTALEHAVDGAPASRLPWFQASLAVALRQRFRTRGDQEDARRATELNEAALAAIPEGAPDRLAIVQSAAVAAAYEGASSQELVARARAVVDATPAGARALPIRLGALAGRLADAFHETLRRPFLDESIETSNRALTLAEPGSVDRASLLDGLAQTLTLRYALDGDETTLDDAIDVAQDAHAGAAQGSFEIVESAFTLARALSLRAARSGAPADLDRTTTAFRRAADLGQDRAPGALLRAGQNWGSWAAEEQRWTEAAEALGGALDATDQLYRRQVVRGDREAWLRLAPDLPATAAVACARAGDDRAAVLALERGRARMLSDALERDRASLDALEAGSSRRLAERFRAAAARLTLLERSELERLDA